MNRAARTDSDCDQNTEFDESDGAAENQRKKSDSGSLRHRKTPLGPSFGDSGVATA